jgi:DNA-binding transcriptional MerR regulator
VSRGPNGYRRFTPLASERLRLIRLGQLVGFSLKEMTSTLRHWDDGTMSVVEKKDALDKQLIRLRRRIDELHSIERFLEDEIAKAC